MSEVFELLKRILSLLFSFFENFSLQLIRERYKTFFIGFLSNFEPMTLRLTCKEKVDMKEM